LIRELGGLACAPLWAVSTILLKSQTDKLNAMRINAFRGISASAFLLIAAAIFGRMEQLATLSLSAVAYLWLSVLIGLVLGDTLYIKGMGIVGASKSLPISIVYPIFVLPFSMTIGDESLSIMAIVGMFIVVAGLYLITAPERGSEKLSGEARRHYWRGVFFVLGATFCWAVGTMVLNFAMTELDPLLAGAIRMPFMTLVLLAIIYFRKGDIKPWSCGLNSLMILSLSGMLGIGFGGLLFMTGIKYAGPAKTAILSSTAPLFGVPLSAITLRERITLKMALGTVLCVLGIWIVIWQTQNAG